MPEIRLPGDSDVPAIAAIYAPVVRDTWISFEETPPDHAEMRSRIARTLRTHPWLVSVAGESVLGYAYAGPHRSRASYRWSVDVSVYVSAEARGRGVGRTLYAALLDILTAQGFVNAYAGIALPNDASVGLHEAMGFSHVATYRGVGYKLGAWRDVGWWHRALIDRPAAPCEPLPLDRVIGSPAWERAMARSGQAR